MLSKFSALQNEFDLFIFDIFGVLWDGSALFPGILELMKNLREAGKTVVIMSNAPDTYERLEEEGTLRGYVKGIHYDRIVSAGDVARLVFSNDERPLKYYIYGHFSERTFKDSVYQEVNTPEEADFIYLGFPVENIRGNNRLCYTVEKFTPDLDRFKLLGKTVVCANPDYTAIVGGYDAPIVCQGSLAAYYEKIGGKVVWFGKPYRDIYDYLLQNYADIDRSKILMIGDTLRTDIAGATDAHIKSALVLTGITAYEMAESGETNIEAYAKKTGIIPNYYLKTLQG